MDLDFEKEIVPESTRGFFTPVAIEKYSHERRVAQTHGPSIILYATWFPLLSGAIIYFKP